MKGKSQIVLVFLIYSVISVTSFSVQDEERIDSLMSAFLNCSGAPGLTLSVVKDGDVQIAKGYGIANLETNEKVTAQTLFGVASVTKQFTAALLSKLLANDGRFNLDTPVKSILGDSFHFITGFRTNNTNLRDLLGHKTGIPRHEIIGLVHQFDRTEALERLRFFESSAPLRDVFIYNNWMYFLAGKVAEELDETDQDYESLVKEHLYDPIGMSGSKFVMNANADYEGFAVPYIPSDGEKLKLPIEFFDFISTTAAAGAIASNADDFSKWLLYLLEGIDPVNNNTAIQELFVSEIPGGPSTFSKPEYEETVSYDTMLARGFFNGAYKGYQVHSHSGNLFGYSSLMSILPAIDTGIFIDTNYAASGLDLLHPFITDLALGEEPWVTEDLICKEAKSFGGAGSHVHTDIEHDVMQMLLKPPVLPRQDMKPDRPLEDYVGMYGNFAWGNATITYDSEEGELIMFYGRNRSFHLIPEGGDSFLLVGRGSPSNLLSLGFVSFESSDESIVDKLSFTSLEVLGGALPRFTRNLKLSEAPPPDVNDCSN